MTQSYAYTYNVSIIDDRQNKIYSATRNTHPFFVAELIPEKIKHFANRNEDWNDTTLRQIHGCFQNFDNGDTNLLDVAYHGTSYTLEITRYEDINRPVQKMQQLALF